MLQQPTGVHSILLVVGVHMCLCVNKVVCVTLPLVTMCVYNVILNNV